MDHEKIRSATIKLKEDEVQAKEHLTAHELELLTRKELDHRLARIRDASSSAA